jgi:hypothetical protein
VRPNERWNRLQEILEAVGYADRQVARILHKATPARYYETRHSWSGFGSAYLTVGALDSLGYAAEITVRMSDHPPKTGGGMRYSERTGDFYRGGEAEVSIHPGSPITLRNVVAAVAANLAVALAAMEAIDAP